MAAEGGWLIDGFITWLRDLDGTTAYFTLLGVLGLCGLGVPIPEDIILISAGFLVSLGKFGLPEAVVAGMVGVLSGDAVLFFVGRRYGRQVFELPWVRRLFPPALQKQAEIRVQENARFICFVARFLPGLRSPIYLTAGALGIPPRTYILQDGLAASISVPVWVGMGWYFGEEIAAALEMARDGQLVVVPLFVLAILAYVVWQVRRGRAGAA